MGKKEFALCTSELLLPVCAQDSNSWLSATAERDAEGTSQVVSKRSIASYPKHLDEGTLKILRKFVRGAYDTVPFKQPVFTLLRRLPVPECFMRHLRFQGVIDVTIDEDHTFRLHNSATYVENDLFWRGYGRGWEATSLLIWKDLSAQAHCILDIGANTGVYSLAAKSCNASASVFAFEPSESVFQMLQANIELNKLNIEAKKAAVSDSARTATLFGVGQDHFYVGSLERRSFEPHEHGRLDAHDVTCVRVDDFISGTTVPSVDLVKIDIEGHEPSALRGFGAILARDKPSILIEILTDEVADQVQAIIAGVGYRIYRITEGSGVIPQDSLRGCVGQHRNFLLSTDAAFKRAGLARYLMADTGSQTTDQGNSSRNT